MSSVAPHAAHGGLDEKASGGKLVFGKYRIHRRLGRGGMGEVYLASLVGELGFEKKLVIKTILPEHAAKPKFIEMFAAEAKTAVSLSHGNIVPIYELGKADETLYIVMGHVDGPSVERMLSEYRKRGAPPEIGMALLVVREVLTGLAYAHTEGLDRPAVVHRDVSPRNVLVDRSGQVRIVDFGIAVPANVESAVRGGSTGYMAPEQARAELADPRADVFSVACMLYELLTLNQAFPKKNIWIAPDMSSIPGALAEVLTDALSLDPLERPANAGAFITVLAPALALHAPAFTDTLLAAHLRALFPEGWEQEDAAASPGDLTPVTNLEPKTYATRLTEVTGGTRVTARPKRETGADEKPDEKRPGRLWPAIALLALGSATVGLIATLPNPDQGGANAGQAAVPPSVRMAAGAADSSPPAPMTDAPSTDAPTTDARTSEPPTTTVPVDDPNSSESDATSEPDPARPVWLTVQVEPSNATVTVGGVALRGTSPFRIPVPSEGEASVRVSHPGFLDEAFTVQAGEAQTLREVALKREPPKGKGYLLVFAPPVSWAWVIVDGKRLKTTPTPKLELSAGTHRVEVRCVAPVCPAPRTLLKQTVTVKAGETTKLTAE